MAQKANKIAVIGGGLVGRSWAMLFASVGNPVTIFDNCSNQLKSALEDIDQQLKILEKAGLLRGNLSANKQWNCIQGSTNLSETVANAILIQECVPEELEVKKSVWKDIDSLVEDNVILSSSTSGFVPSKISMDLKNRRNFIVSHPVYPPYHIPLVEIMPATWTTPQVVQKTKTIMEEIGQTPIVLKKEIDFFVLNNIQRAIIETTIALVTDGVISTEDADKAMSHGLGPRYAFIGPLTCAHLAAEGFRNFYDKYGKNLIGKEIAEVEVIAADLERMIPLDQLKNKRLWRDKCLTKLSQLKKTI